MNKIFATAVALLFAMSMVPNVSATFSATQEYDVASGVWPIGAVTARPCAEEWRSGWYLIGDDPDNGIDDPTDDGEGNAPYDPQVRGACEAVDPENDGAIRFGVFSAGLQAPTDSYTNFIATIEDDLFESTFMTFCIITEYANGAHDNLCNGLASEQATNGDDATEDFQDSGCGTRTVSTGNVLSGGDANNPSAFVYADYADPENDDLCFGSSGSVTVTMS